MDQERLKLLREMLEQVNPSMKTDQLKESLESASGGGSGGETLDVAMGSSPSGMDSQIATESLDLLVQDREIGPDNQFALEAIVMPFYRPVVDIVNNRMTFAQLSPQWKHLGQTAEINSRIEAALLSIGRIEIPGHPTLPYAGTGFVAGDGLIMTNRHVAEIFATGLGFHQLRFKPGQNAEVDFLKEAGNAPSSTTSDLLAIESIAMIHPFWDMALLKVKGLPAKRKPLVLSTADPSALQDREVVVVGYPGYDPTGDKTYQDTQSRIFRGIYFIKRLQPGMLRVRKDFKSFERMVPAITHDCSTLGGNSGSAVIDVQTGHIVGLHFAGAYLKANYAVPSFDLASDRRVVDAGVNFADSAAVPADQKYDPFWTATGSGTVSDDESPPAGTHTQSPNATAVPSSQNETSQNIPVHFSISLGKPKIEKPTIEKPEIKR